MLLAASAVVIGQVAPAATGPGSIPLSGSLHYSVRYSQTAMFGNLEGDRQSGTVSGDADYANTNARRPFTMAYGGGYSFHISGPSYANGLSQHLTLSQGIVERKWSASVNDNLSYLPQSPIGGFSGIAGAGDLTGSSGSSTTSDQTILTVNTRTLDNAAMGTFERRINHATSFSAGGGYTLMKYPDGNGMDTSTETAHAGINQRLNARNSLSGQYSYSNYTSTSTGTTSGATFKTQAGTGSFQRTWTRALSTSVSSGPQWTSSSDSAVVPSTTRLTVSASATYAFHTSSASLSFNRGTTGGNGVLPGGQTQSVAANYAYSRKIGRDVYLGLTSTLTHMSMAEQLGNLVTNSGSVSTQATRRLGRYANIFASYSAVDQSSSTALAANVLSGLNQTISFGIGYSPRETHLRP